MTEGTHPTRCEVCGKAYALKKPDPDGGRRCVAHSTDPLTLAKRERAAAQGAATAAKLQGVAPEQRRAVMAGVVSIEDARAEKAKESKHREVAPIPLDSKENVLAFLARVSGELMDEKPNGWASAAASIAGTALKAMGLEEQTAPEAEVVGFSVEVVDRNSKVN